MADKEHTLPVLGESEILSVKDPPAHAIPELDHAPNDGAEVSPVSAGKKAIDVFDQNPAGTQLANDASELPP